MVYVILVYDIKLDEKGPRILRNVFKIVKKYLHHIQNSVFEGDVSEAQIIKLKFELADYIRKDVDSVIMFESRSEKWLEKEFLGMKDDNTSNFL